MVMTEYHKSDPLDLIALDIAALADPTYYGRHEDITVEDFARVNVRGPATCTTITDDAGCYVQVLEDAAGQVVQAWRVDDVGVRMGGIR